MALLASATAAQAASVTFWTLDDQTRTVYFTPNPGSEDISPAENLSSSQNMTVNMPDTWAGNFYAVVSDASNTPGMLGEVDFAGWGGLTFFDVSAIVNPNDHDGVHQLFPANDLSPSSGCEVFPCNDCYWSPDEDQTKSTSEKDLVTTLGESS